MIKPFYEDKSCTIYHGDNLDIIPGLESNSIDTIITDPPYALEFMGKAWDKVLPARETWVECLRVAKPGAMMLVFGGDRTHHRLMVDIEDAGWEIRTCIYWLFGSGFPKSRDISKAVDKLKGAKREVLERKIRGDVQKAKARGVGYLADPANRGNVKQFGYGVEDITLPVTPEAQLWHGWGTALKPAAEIIVVAMKPLEGTFAENALKHGVAGLAIDKARIGVENIMTHGGHRSSIENYRMTKEIGKTHQGRWPSNLLFSHHPECREIGVKKMKVPRHRDGYLIEKENFGGTRSKTPLGKNDHSTPDGTETVPAYECHPDCAVRMLDEQSGISYSKGGGGKKSPVWTESTKDQMKKDYGEYIGFLDSGGASRFFYCAKASRSERGKDNKHPTVKPLKLMEYLCKLTMTPAGGTVLDPFGGSGTTALACQNVGRKCILIEKDDCEVAVRRLS